MSRAATIPAGSWPRRMDAEHTNLNETFIYFLRAGEFVKIGQSRRWKSRLDQMQTGSPYTIVPLLILRGSPAMEKTLHSRFRADHFRGEWFRLGPAVRAFIKSNLKLCQSKSEITELAPPPITDIADDL